MKSPISISYFCNWIMSTEAMSTEAPGNTIAGASEQLQRKGQRKGCFGPARGFAWTLFQLEEWNDLYTYFKSRASFRYIVCGKEVCPKTGRDHYQGYVYYDRAIHIPKSKIGSLHIEVAKYNATINEKYCKKGGNIIVEEGEKPHPGKALTGEDLIEMTKEEIVHTDPYNHRALLAAKDLLTPIKASKWSKEVVVEYVWGPSGSGKSTYVQKKLIEMGDPNFDLITYRNGFWIGMTGMTDVAVYEEFRFNTVQPEDFIKLIDYRIHRMNIKGGAELNKYTTIFITSVDDPNLSWHYEDQKQWIRRMKITHLVLTEQSSKSEI